MDSSVAVSLYSSSFGLAGTNAILEGNRQLGFLQLSLSLVSGIVGRIPRGL